MKWWMPPAPSASDLAKACPKILPVSSTGPRPFWSIMIPTYNCGDYLRRTLASVLPQALDPAVMQIEVIDDCSTKDDPEKVVAELGRGRVEFFRQPVNRGIPQTFNTCIERARGEWVHILHGDDMVLPGFYEEYGRLIASNPDAVMVVGQVVIIDEKDRWMGLYGPLPNDQTGIVYDFTLRQAIRQLGQFPGVVVRRDSYERVGGFCTLLTHTADFDMWFRVGQLGPVLGTERPFAMYRIHDAADTSKHRVLGTNIEQTFWVIRANAERLKQCLDESGWRERLADTAETTAWDLDAKGILEGRLNQLRWALLLRPSAGRLWRYIKTWVKVKIFRARLAMG